jgi:hypothetical protein
MRQLAVRVDRSTAKESTGQLSFRCSEFPKGRLAQEYFNEGWTLDLEKKISIEDGRHEYYLLEKKEEGEGATINNATMAALLTQVIALLSRLVELLNP